jgi:hypothetical protein
MHTTNKLDDGYLGSGKILKRSIKKYGKENHIKEILDFCDSRDAVVSAEKRIVTEDLVNHPLSMNIRTGGEGGGGWTRDQQRENNRKSQISQQLLRENDDQWVKRKSTKMTEANNLAYKEGRIPNTPDWTGRNHTEYTKKKLSLLKKGKGLGGENTNAKCVIDDNGNVFSTYYECAEFNNIHTSTVKRKVEKGIYNLVNK